MAREQSSIISLEIQFANQAIIEEGKHEGASPMAKAANLPKFSQIFFPECGTKVVYEYLVPFQKCYKHTIDTPWAFPSSFAFC